ncbi:MAG: helix-hairpin-helix domain-containing protein, partial [Lachnospiraceae bacterium]|nr:helix-hairpin-helix domain-containing protein [Lachnospiraceae bacterium]
NTATLEELSTLTGIGATRAKAIIDYREKNGPFNTKEDLMLVNGIKQGIYDGLKDEICAQ